MTSRRRPPSGSPAGSLKGSGLPSLLRCTSTPMAPSYFNFGDLLSGEAHLSFGGSPSAPSVLSDRAAKVLEAPPEDDSGVHTLSLQGDSTAGDFSVSSVSSEECSSSVHDESLGAVPKRRSPRLRDLRTPSPPPAPRRRSSFPPGHFLTRDKVDPLRLLSERGMWHVVEQIINCLDGASLCSAARVSSPWRAIVAGSADAARRQKEFLTARKIDAENPLRDSGSRSYFGSPRKAMANKSNILPVSPSYSKKEREKTSKPFISPSKIRHHLFAEVKFRICLDLPHLLSN